MQQQLEPRTRTVGRPKLGTETKFIGFKVDIETKNRIEAAARNLDLKNSDIIRVAVESFLDDFEKSI